MEICGLSTIINFTPKKHKIWKIRCFQVSWNCIKSLHIYLTQLNIVFIDQKEPIQVEKASNNSFLKKFNLTKRTLMYHCVRLLLDFLSTLFNIFNMYYKNSYLALKVRQKLQISYAKYDTILRILILHQKWGQKLQKLYAKYDTILRILLLRQKWGKNPRNCMQNMTLN